MEVVSVAFSPDGKTLASGSWDTTVRVWDSVTGKQRWELFMLIRGESVNSVAFSPDGKTVAAAYGVGDKTIKLWDPVRGELGPVLRGHAHAVTAIAFSPDGKTLASADWRGGIKLWPIYVLR
jgi:WD40 repeat protein